MRLLCDEMLARFARWLRAAGHDTVLAEPGTSDDALLARAGAEDRLLVTKSRELAGRAGSRGVLIRGESADEEAMSLSAKVPADWRLAPFTRCVMDNAELRPARPEELARLPERARGLPGPFNLCPACGRLYWPGSHVRRMAARLERWAEAAACPS